MNADVKRPAVVACGYVGLSCPDLAPWREFATALGMEVGTQSTEETLFLRVDDRAFRVCVERGPILASNGVNFVGWEVSGERALEDLTARLRAAGVAVTEDAELARTRRVDRLAYCLDPGGNRLEFFTGALTPKKPFISPTGVRFVTGKGGAGNLGFGHVVTTFEDVAAARHFYIDLLEMRLTDTAFAHAVWYFLRVNPRHHSIAFAQYKGPSVFHHLMLEVETLDMVGTCHDRLQRMGASFATTLGRHNNDHMVSFYVRTPSSVEIEYGCDGVLIDEGSHVITTYEGAEIWGHQSIRA